MVQCNYSRISSRYRQYEQGIVLPAFDPACSGGCLYDINLYNLHFVTGLFGRPEEVDYYANLGFNGVDTSGTAGPRILPAPAGPLSREQRAGFELRDL